MPHVNYGNRVERDVLLSCDNDLRSSAVTAPRSVARRGRKQRQRQEIIQRHPLADQLQRLD